MSHYENSYINHVKEYIESNTPLNFMLDQQKYDELEQNLNDIDINYQEKHIVIACYSLLYTGINYHMMVKEKPQYKSYYILVGDFISSYVLELLYEHKLSELNYLFIVNTKKILINTINDKCQDTLLTDIVKFYKGS